MLERGEDPAAAALRELREETGYRAARMRYLWSAYSTPGFCTELLRFLRGRRTDAGRVAARRQRGVRGADLHRGRGVGDGRARRTPRREDADRPRLGDDERLLGGRPARAVRRRRRSIMSRDGSLTLRAMRMRAQEPDREPGHVELEPAQAMASGERERVVVVVPALAEREQGDPPAVASSGRWCDTCDSRWRARRC